MWKNENENDGADGEKETKKEKNYNPRFLLSRLPLL
jgi:hypothetical protein